MQNEMNRAVGMSGNQAMNLPASIPRTGLRVSCETLGRHVLNILCPCILRNVWRPKILLNRHVIPAW
jgi:hypothetical protein